MRSWQLKGWTVQFKLSSQVLLSLGLVLLKTKQIQAE